MAGRARESASSRVGEDPSTYHVLCVLIPLVTVGGVDGFVVGNSLSVVDSSWSHCGEKRGCRLSMVGLVGPL
jgi:hypothetical protein